MSFGSGNKHGWKPGQSGNPGGRPKAIVEVAKAAREHTLEAIATLREIMRNNKATASARVSAAAVLLERGWGKAPQTITINNHNLADLSDNELISIALGEDDGEATSTDGAASPPSDPNKLN